MPSERSARVSQRRQARNRSMRSALRTSRTKAQRAMAAGDGAEEAVKAAIQTMDKVASKGAIHRNKAARLKSRLTRKLNASLQG